MIDRDQSKKMFTALYNLLCLYFMKANAKKICYDPIEHAQDNGHVFITNAQLYAVYREHVEPDFGNLFNLTGDVLGEGYYLYEENNPPTPTEIVRNFEVILSIRSKVSKTDLHILEYSFSAWEARTPSILAWNVATSLLKVHLKF